MPKRLANCTPTSRDQITRVAGLVVNVKHIKTKRGKMGVVTLDDRSIRIEAVIYGDLYEQSQLLQKDTVLIIGEKFLWMTLTMIYVLVLKTYCL